MQISSSSTCEWLCFQSNLIWLDLFQIRPKLFARKRIFVNLYHKSRFHWWWSKPAFSFSSIRTSCTAILYYFSTFHLPSIVHTICISKSLRLLQWQNDGGPLGHDSYPNKVGQDLSRIFFILAGINQWQKKLGQRTRALLKWLMKYNAILPQKLCRVTCQWRS